MSDRAIQSYCSIWGRPIPVWKQSGGGTVLYKGHPITIREDVKQRFIEIHGGIKAAGRTCFILEIFPNTGNATLKDLEAGRWGDTCFTDGYQESSALVKVILWIAKKRGARRIEFTDNSMILCPDKEQKIVLSELSFITTGQTWYERQIPDLKPVDASKAERLERWRSNVMTRTWGEVLPWITGFGSDPEIPHMGAPEENAKDVLTRMKRSGQWCNFFANEMDHLRKAFGIDIRIHGWHWSASLVGPTTSRTEKRRTTRKKSSIVMVEKDDS
jgi:hypothetical protein